MKKLIPFLGLILLLGCHKMAKVDQFNLTLGEKGIATSSGTSGEAPAPAVENDRLPDAPLAVRVPAGVPAPVAEAPKEKGPLEEAVAALRDGAQDILNRGSAEEAEEEVPFSPEIGGGDLSPLVPFIENYVDLDAVTRPATNVEREAPIYVTRMELTLTLGEGTNAVGPVFFDYMKSPAEGEPVDIRLPAEHSFEMDPRTISCDGDPAFNNNCRYSFHFDFRNPVQLDLLEYFRIRNITSGIFADKSRLVLRGIELQLYNAEERVKTVSLINSELDVNVSRNMVFVFPRTSRLREKLVRSTSFNPNKFRMIFQTTGDSYNGGFLDFIFLGQENSLMRWNAVRPLGGFHANRMDVIDLCTGEDLGHEFRCSTAESPTRRSLSYPLGTNVFSVRLTTFPARWTLESFIVAAQLPNASPGDEYFTLCSRNGGILLDDNNPELQCRPSYIVDLYQP